MKKKKKPGDIIILHLHTTNDDHMTYGSWYMEHNRQNFLSSWAAFCSFTQRINWKIKSLKKWNNYLEILLVYTCALHIIWCMVLEICSATIFFLILDHFLPFYPPNNPENHFFEKMKKNTRTNHHFTQVQQKSWSYAILFLQYGMWPMFFYFFYFWLFFGLLTP